MHSPLAFVGAMLFARALLVCSAGVVTREAAMAVGGFDTRLRVREDLDFFAFVARRFGVRFIDEVSLHFRISHTASLMHKAGRTAEQVEAEQRLLRQASAITNAKYAESFGHAELVALKAFSRLVLRRL